MIQEIVKEIECIVESFIEKTYHRHEGFAVDVQSGILIPIKDIDLSNYPVVITKIENIQTQLNPPPAIVTLTASYAAPRDRAGYNVDEIINSGYDAINTLYWQLFVKYQHEMQSLSLQPFYSSTSKDRLAGVSGTMTYSRTNTYDPCCPH